MKRTILTCLLFCVGLTAILATRAEAQKTLKTLSILGGYGTRGDVDPFTEASRDNGQTWQPAYLTGWHPWGFAAGTNSWINFDPNPYVGLNSVTDYRITFYIPQDFEQPTMNFVVKADNRARITVNGVFISEFDGQNSGSAGDLVLAQSLRSGLNEITLRLTDWGGIVGLNYRIDVSMYSAFEPSIKPPSIRSNAAPVAAAGVDQSFNCVVGSANVTLNGSGSSDADGDQLSYSWSLGGSVVSTASSFTTSLGGGNHTFTLTVSDGKDQSSDQVTVAVTLDQTPPVLTVPADVTVNANATGGYSGSIGTATAVDGCGQPVTLTSNAPAVFPLGETTVQYTAIDIAGNSSTGVQKVTVRPYPILVDIKPGSSNNVVNFKNKGVVPVAVLTNANFDATKLKISSLRFGPGGAPEAHGIGHYEDVDKDGDVDLMLHFDTQATGLTNSDGSATLVGVTLSGVPVSGNDGLNLNKLGKDGAATDEDAGENSVPTEFSLGQNYPNPFNPSTTISFTVPTTGYARMVVINSIGQEVATLFDATASEGRRYSVTFNANELSTGLYMYRLNHNGKSISKKMMLVK